jgi:PAS domain S-box-containing protein
MACVGGCDISEAAMGLGATELETRLECLQAVADNLPALIAYWDENECCRFANRACSSWLRRDPKALIGTSMRQVLGEELYKQNKPFIDGVLRGESQTFERGLLDPQGALRETQISYVPDLQNGEVHGFYVLINDISSSKRAEAAALESRTQLQALLAAVPEYILSLDRSGKIMFANRTVVTPMESLIGRSVHQFFPEEYRDLTTRAVEAAFTAHKPASFESVANLGDVKRWFVCQFVPVVRDGETTSVLLVSRDVTRHKQMEMQLLAAERLAAVGSLSAGVAHEINTPVQFVSDSVEFLRESSAELFMVLEKLLALQRAGDDPQLRNKLSAQAQACIEDVDLEYLQKNIPQAIDRSLAGLKRVAEIVRSLKAFSHLDQKEMTDAQLDQIIDTSLTLAANEYKYVAEVVRDYAELPTVRCHVGGISQVILNIVINAAHAIAEKIKDRPELGRITISTRDEGDYAVIRISDTGGGVPKQIRAKIFAPFFTTKPVGKGTGQGLAISWTIITQDHHGELWFESEEGIGTTFYIRIPKDPAQLSTESSSPAISDFTTRSASTPAVPLREIA